MITREYNPNWTSLTLSLMVALCSLETCLAAKGGNGGGKPGGEDPPPTTIPVSYSVTLVTLPGGRFYFNDHNESAAVVGWNSESTRAVAYLPSLGSAFYLDDPALNVNFTGIPSGWHPRSAIGINNHGTIVGNLQISNSEDLVTTPFLLTGIGSGTPILEKLELLDLDSHRESALRINDSGDMVISSKKTVNGVEKVSLYVGNPGLHGSQIVAFQKVTYPGGWDVNDLDAVRLSNRIGSSPAILSGIVFNDDGDRRPYRMQLDGTAFEVSPTYIDAQGSLNYWWLANDPDLNDSGDLAGVAFVEPAKQGKQKNNTYAGVWLAGTDEYVPAGSDTALQSEWDFVKFNNDDDFLLESGGLFDTLWQDTWSAANGALAIIDLIDSDPNRDLFSHALEITDQRANDWPTIIARGSEAIDGVEQNMLLILDPVLNTTSAAIARVPEPSAVFITLMAIVSLASGRSSRRR